MYMPSSSKWPMLIWGNSFLVLDLSLDIINSVRAFDLQGNCLSSESLDEDLHATTKTKNQVEGGLLLNVVVS